MITSVVKMYDEDVELDSLWVTYENGKVYGVPKVEGNRHYREVLAWVAEGNQIGEPE